MDIRGVKLKKITRRSGSNELFILKPSEYYSVPMLADDGDKSHRAVNVGEKVKEGSLIGKPTGKYGSYVYSPCSGVVIGVVKKLNASGNNCEHIVIKRNFDDEKEYLKLIPLIDQNHEILLKRLYECGAVDNFYPFDPAYKKYLLKNAISKLVINCTEVDPYVACESALFEVYLSEVVEGAKLLAEIAKTETIQFNFTTKQKHLVKLLKAHIKKAGLKDKLKIKIYPHVYPLDNARLIGYYETGRMVFEGSRTAETNVIVECISNCYDFYNAVNKGIPVTQKVVTVTGSNCLRKANYFIKNGTPVNHILEVVGTKEPGVENKLIYGGIMSGIAQESLDISATLTASCILFCDSREYSKDHESACINCGRCVSVCPVKLHVKNLDEAIVKRDFYSARKLGVKACISCGACSYVCPAKRYLSQKINFAKDYAMNKKAKTANSSEYVLVAGEDMPKAKMKFDKILHATEKFETVDENLQISEIDAMLQMLEKAREKKGGNK